MKRTWDSKRLPEHEDILKKYNGNIHDEDYKHEVFLSNMQNYRDRHREDLREYNRKYQQKYREERRFYYGLLMWNRKHPNNQMDLESYIEYRKQKEIRRQEKLARKKHETTNS